MGWFKFVFCLNNLHPFPLTHHKAPCVSVSVKRIDRAIVLTPRTEGFEVSV